MKVLDKYSKLKSSSLAFNIFERLLKDNKMCVEKVNLGVSKNK